MSSLIFNKTAANFYRKVKILFCVFLKASVTFDHGVCWGRLSWQPLGTMVNTGEKEEPKLKQFSFFIHNFLIIIILHLHSNSDTTTELKYWQTHRHTHTRHTQLQVKNNIQVWRTNSPKTAAAQTQERKPESWVEDSVCPCVRRQR